VPTTVLDERRQHVDLEMTLRPLVEQFHEPDLVRFADRQRRRERVVRPQCLGTDRAEDRDQIGREDQRIGQHLDHPLARQRFGSLSVVRLRGGGEHGEDGTVGSGGDLDLDLARRVGISHVHRETGLEPHTVLRHVAEGPKGRLVLGKDLTGDVARKLNGDVPPRARLLGLGQ
jgi:hypothetical protein